MDQSRWHRNTTLLALGMSVDHMLRTDTLNVKISNVNMQTGTRLAKIATSTTFVRKVKTRRTESTTMSATTRYRRLV